MSAVSRVPVIARVRTSRGICRFWAERGLVCFEKSDGSYGQMSISTAEERLAGFRAMLRGSGMLELGVADSRVEKKRMIKAVNDLHDVIQLAREQGHFEDPTALRDYALRAPKTLSMHQAERDKPRPRKLIIPGVND